MTYRSKPNSKLPGINIDPWFKSIFTTVIGLTYLLLLALLVMKDRSDLEPVRISYLFAITAIALSSIIFLFKEYSAPKNWWAAFYGYDIEVSPRVGRAYNSDIHAQLQQWFLDNGDPEKFSLLRWKYRFLHRSDAVLFKMVWG